MNVYRDPEDEIELVEESKEPERVQVGSVKLVKLPPRKLNEGASVSCQPVNRERSLGRESVRTKARPNENLKL